MTDRGWTRLGWLIMTLNAGCVVALYLSSRGRNGVESFAQGCLAMMALRNVGQFLEKRL